MPSKERPSISDKFRKNLRDKATAAVIPLAILLPTSITINSASAEETHISGVYSGQVRSGYENVITTFAPKKPEVNLQANEIVGFQSYGNAPEVQVFSGSEMIPAAAVVESIAEREHLPYVPLWRQADSRWGWKRYGTASMADSGCAPTSLAMAISYYKGRYIQPDETAKVSLKHHWRVPYVGTSYEAMEHMPELYGLKSDRATWSEAKKALRQGKLVIQSHGVGYFTSGGHVILLTGVTKDGTYKINDPGPRHKSRATERQVKGSLQASWIISDK
jgi:hypothetical protein